MNGIGNLTQVSISLVKYVVKREHYERNGTAGDSGTVR